MNNSFNYNGLLEQNINTIIQSKYCKYHYCYRKENTIRYFPIISTSITI